MGDQKWRGAKQLRDARLVMPRKEMRPGHRNIYLYFDNDAKVRAPVDAQSLREAVEALLEKAVA